MPSSHLILCHPLLLLPPIPPSIRVFSNESTLRMRWPKYWSFSFSIIRSNEHRADLYVICIYMNSCFITFLCCPLYHYIISTTVCPVTLYGWYGCGYIHFLWLPFASRVIFHPFTLSLCLSLGLRWVSWRQHIVFWFIWPLCLLNGEFNPFILRVVIDKWRSSAAILFSGWSISPSFLFLVFLSF